MILITKIKINQKGEKSWNDLIKKKRRIDRIRSFSQWVIMKQKMQETINFNVMQRLLTFDFVEFIDPVVKFLGHRPQALK